MEDRDIIDALEQLENAISVLPEDIPFRLVIKSFTGMNVIPIENEDIINDIFSIVQNYLTSINTNGMQFEKPIKLRVSLSWRIIQDLILLFEENGYENCEKEYKGYPRLKVEKEGLSIYITIKTSEDLSGAARTFYISKKGIQNRISDNGHHLVFTLEFVMEEEEDIYFIVYFRNLALYDLSQLTLRLKPELNATPIDLIKKTRLLRRKSLD